MSVLAVYSLVVAHPGPMYERSDIYESDVIATSDDFREKSEPRFLGMQQSV